MYLINVWPLLAIHLNANKPFVQHFRYCLLLERLHLSDTRSHPESPLQLHFHVFFLGQLTHTAHHKLSAEK